MNNKIYLSILMITLSILMVSFGSAVINELPDTVKLNQCANLIQVDNVLTENITSILKPNGIEKLNVVMTKDGTFFNYTYCNNNVTGSYTVNGVDNNGTTWAYDYKVNAQGKEYNSIDGLLYIIAIFVLLIIFGISLYGFFMIPFENNKTEEGSIASISYKKYLKILSLMVAYVSAIAISYFLWNLTYGILEVTEMAKFFYFIYRSLFVGLIVLFPVIVIISFVRYIYDNKIYEMLQRGLTVK